MQHGFRHVDTGHSCGRHRQYPDISRARRISGKHTSLHSRGRHAQAVKPALPAPHFTTISVKGQTYACRVTSTANSMAKAMLWKNTRRRIWDSMP